MSTHTLKSVVRRGTMFGATFALVAAVFAPLASPTYADALNPLTDRSLTLSSSAPGWDYLDGSGNATYAPPNSGANGQKVGNTFDFKVSTDTTTGDNVKAISFQYCTSPAGNCLAPGNNEYTEDEEDEGVFIRNSNAASAADQKSDLEVVISSPSEATLASQITDLSVATNPDGVVSSVPARNSTGTNYMVYYVSDPEGTPTDPSDDVWVQSTGWTMTVTNNETGSEADQTATGKDNEIRLVKASGQGFASGTRVKVVFFATDANYITNPGDGAFFVRMNTYKSPTTFASGDVIDGGVTVANVMNLGIQITTKVLETMDFSVGVVDPYTLQALEDDNGTEESGGADETSQLYVATDGKSRKHSTCERILTKMNPTDQFANRLQLGSADDEFSLSTDHTYSTHSYWRLSSNSSAGATVYYSGNTLTNTVEDDIDPIYGSSPNDGLAAAPQVGREQFGLALANGTIAQNNPLNLDFENGVSVHAVNYTAERTAGKVYENGADNTANGLIGGTYGIDPSVTDDDISNLDANPSWHTPRLYPLVPTTNYDGGAGSINTDYAAINTKFAFDPNSMLIPVPIASQDQQVVNCVTGKMRYIANIAATTPAGIYTTKINYIAAPQY